MTRPMSLAETIPLGMSLPHRSPDPLDLATVGASGSRSGFRNRMNPAMIATTPSTACRDGVGSGGGGGGS